MTDLVWQVFEKSGSINYYLLYKALNQKDDRKLVLDGHPLIENKDSLHIAQN